MEKCYEKGAKKTYKLLTEVCQDFEEEIATKLLEEFQYADELDEEFVVFVRRLTFQRMESNSENILHWINTRLKKVKMFSLDFEMDESARCIANYDLEKI